MFRAALKKCVAPFVICIIWCGAVVAQPLEPRAALNIGFIPDEGRLTLGRELWQDPRHARHDEVPLCISTEISDMMYH